MAKLHGNYSRLSGGIGSEGISYLNGSPFEDLNIRSTTEEKLWDWVEDKLDRRWLLTAKSKCSGTDRSK